MSTEDHPEPAQLSGSVAALAKGLPIMLRHHGVQPPGDRWHRQSLVIAPLVLASIEFILVAPSCKDADACCAWYGDGYPTRIMELDGLPLVWLDVTLGLSLSDTAVVDPLIDMEGHHCLSLYREHIVRHRTDRRPVGATAIALLAGCCPSCLAALCDVARFHLRLAGITIDDCRVHLGLVGGDGEDQEVAT